MYLKQVSNLSRGPQDQFSKKFFSSTSLAPYSPSPKPRHLHLSPLILCRNPCLSLRASEGSVPARRSVFLHQNPLQVRYGTQAWQSPYFWRLMRLPKLFYPLAMTLRPGLPGGNGGVRGPLSPIHNAFCFLPISN
jgi:hypothetical protein